MVRRESRFELENDPALVPPLVAMLQEDVAVTGLCSASDLLRVGIALEEVLLNSLYHGNLEVDSGLKMEPGDAFHRKARERREQAPYRDRRLRVTAAVSLAEATFVIQDEGPGFDPAQLPDPTDPANLERPCGRGVLLIRTFMDSVEYADRGRRCTLVKRRGGH